MPGSEEEMWNSLDSFAPPAPLSPRSWGDEAYGSECLRGRSEDEDLSGALPVFGSEDDSPRLIHSPSDTPAAAAVPGPVAKKAGSKRKAASELCESSGSPSKEKVRLQNKQAQQRTREKKKLSDMLRLKLMHFFQLCPGAYPGNLDVLCEGLVRHLVELKRPFEELQGQIERFLSQPDHKGGDLATLFSELKRFL